MNSPEIPKFSTKVVTHISKQYVMFDFQFEDPVARKFIPIEKIIIPYDAAQSFCEHLKFLLDESKASGL